MGEVSLEVLVVYCSQLLLEQREETSVYFMVEIILSVKVLVLWQFFLDCNTVCPVIIVSSSNHSSILKNKFKCGGEGFLGSRKYHL